MHHFCTLFDSNYLSRGLAMYYSLHAHCNNFHLYIFAFDSQAYKILVGLNLPRVTAISLAEFEDKKLLEIKSSRNIAEYCWTCTSSTILYVLNNFKVEECTYIDADLYFYSSPQPIFDEMGDKSILLTEHRFSTEFRKDVIKGKYCVQFITFRNNALGRIALEWWRERCLEWCYARLEDGKFGDQGYLNDWTTRFEGVHVLNHLGGGVAAWNVQQYAFLSLADKIHGREISTGKTFDLIFYHFHYLRFFKGNILELGRRYLSPAVLNLLYKPYVHELMHSGRIAQKFQPNMDPHGIRVWPLSWKSPIIYLYRKLKNVYNVFDKDEFLRK